MKERQQLSTNYPIGFMLVLKSDHITGAVGKASTITLTISKNAALGFSPPAGAPGTIITEVGNGWYYWNPVGADRSDLGELRIHVDEPSCDPYDEKYDIVQYDPYAYVSLPASERTSIADAILTRDWSQVTGWAARSLIQAMRLLRNKWGVDTTGKLTVCIEDDATTAWTGQLQSQQGADPIVGQTPQ
jgi:hypothetical protein